jgi:tetratricopeptide (TPR) repeat protein
MGDYETALAHHENDLKLADKLHSSMRQSRAFGNLGLVYELLHEHKKASECQEQHLSIAAQVSDRVAKVNAYSSLGRNHYLMANFAQAISYFKQGLTIAETLGRSEDEATIRWAD